MASGHSWARWSVVHTMLPRSQMPISIIHGADRGVLQGPEPQGDAAGAEAPTSHGPAGGATPAVNGREMLRPEQPQRPVPFLHRKKNRS